MSSFNENLLKYTRAEEAVLRARLEAIRAAIPPKHRADKGRSAELAVYRFLRETLPAEYGLTTGFIAYHVPECILERTWDVDGGKAYQYIYLPHRDSIAVSSQLDVIIYDALRFAPLAKLESCDVLPFEAVLAYVEVKSYIDNQPDQKTGLTPLQAILQQSNRIRQIKTRLYWLSKPGRYTKTLLLPYPIEEAVSIRSLVFVLDAASDLADWQTVKALLEAPDAAKQDGFLSSMYIQDVGYFCSHHAESDKDPLIGTFEGTPDNALALFKTAVFSMLSRFPKAESGWTPAIDRYYNNNAVEVVDVRLVKKQGEPAKVVVTYRDEEL